jgi:hypothetical protein
MDVRKYFDNVSVPILEKKLEKIIHDKKTMELLDEILHVVPKGIPLGFYTSQWFANFYLTELDHYIKEELGAVYYVRYMDDMVIFGSNKRKLAQMREKIEQYLKDELNLELKGNWQIFRFIYKKNGREYGRFLDFMGFRFYRGRIALRRSIMLRMTRKAAKIRNKGQPTIFDVRQMMSALGWIRATDTYGMYEVWIKPFINFGKLKKSVSKYDKNRRKIVNEMENSGRLFGQQATAI